MQSFDSGILGETPNDIIQSRLLNIANGGKFINCDMAFLSQLSYSLLCKNTNQVPVLEPMLEHTFTIVS